jgi:cbb3-type cytochrome oxidase maturation protein
MDSMYLLIFLTVCAGFAGWMLFLWAVKSGQYDDVEGPKYRMLDDDEDDGKTEEDKELQEEKKERTDQ